MQRLVGYQCCRRTVRMLGYTLLVTSSIRTTLTCGLNWPETTLQSTFGHTPRVWKRIDSIPSNLILTASYGGRRDDLIERFGLKNVKVYKTLEEVPEDRPIDRNDDWARVPLVNFALLDNMLNSKKEK